MTLRRQAAHGLRWQALEVAGRQLLTLAVFTTLARLLQPVDFGLIGIVGAYLAFVNMFVDLGISTALVQRRELEPAHLDAAFWFNLLCAVVLCLGTFATAPLLADLAGEPRVVPLLRWASLTLVINAAGAVHAARFVKAIDFRYLTYRTVLATAIGGSVGVAMALAGYGVWSLIAQQLLTTLTATGFLWAVSSWRPSLRFSLTHLSDLVGVSLSVFLSALLWTFASRIDQIVIGRFAGAAALGHYVVGIRLAEVARTAIQEPIANISMPALSQVQSDVARLRQALYNAIELHAVVCFAAFGGLAAIAPTIVPLVFGPQWISTGPILQFVAAYSLVVALSVFFHPALLASGGIGRYLAVNVVCAAGAAAACLVGIQTGVRTVVVLMTVNALACAGLALLFLRHRIQLSIWRFCRPCIVPIIAAGLMFLGVTATRMLLMPATALWARAVVEMAVGAAIYMFTTWTLAASTVIRLKDLAAAALSPRAAAGATAEVRSAGVPL